MLHPAFSIMCVIGLDLSESMYSNNCFLSTLENISQQLHVLPSLECVEMISGCTNEFKSMWNINSTPEVLEVMLKIIFKIIRICKVQQQGREHIVKRLMTAAFPEACSNLLTSSNVFVRTMSFDFLIEILKMVPPGLSDHWDQFAAAGGFQRLLPDMMKSDISDEFRSNVLSVLILKYEQYGSRTSECLSSNSIRILLDLFLRHTNKLNMPSDQSHTRTICSIHISDEDDDDNSANIQSAGKFLSVIAEVCKKNGYIDLPLKQIRSFCNYITTGLYVFRDTFTILIRWLQQSFDLNLKVPINMLLLPQLYLMDERRVTECVSCRRNSEGILTLVPIFQSHITCQRTRNFLNIAEKHMYFLTYALIEVSPTQLIMFNKKSHFVSLVLGMVNRGNVDISLQALLRLMTLLMSYKNRLSESQQVKMLKKFCLLYNRVRKMPRGKGRAKLTMEAIAASELMVTRQSVQTCNVSRHHPDMEFVVGSKTLKVNRAFLASRNAFFQAMLLGEFQEARCNVVSIPDCDPDTFAFLVHVLYDCRQCASLRRTSFTKEQVYQLVTMADMYDVPQLQFYALWKLAVGVWLRDPAHQQIIVNLREILSAEFYGLLLTFIFVNSNCTDIPHWPHLLEPNPGVRKCFNHGLTTWIAALGISERETLKG